MRKADEFLLIIFIIGMVYFILPVPVVSGYPPHSRDECTPNIACFVQGDYLKYYVTVKGEPYQYLNYTHEGLGEENTILVGDWVHSVSEFPISTYDGSKFVNPAQLFFKVNLKAGISNDEIFVLNTIPFDTNHWLENNWNVTEDSFIYKTLSRPVLIVTFHNMKYVIDRETGITLYYQNDDPNSSRYVKIYSLIDSNIIQSVNEENNQNSSELNTAWIHPDTGRFQTPLKMMKFGIEPQAVVCNGDFIKLYKLHQDVPVCVKPSTADILIERGWRVVIN